MQGVLVLVPLVESGVAGIEPAHPVNRTVRDIVFVAHVHDEKVMLEAASVPPPWAAGVRTAMGTTEGVDATS
jgi:hypothetical protein